MLHAICRQAAVHAMKLTYTLRTCPTTRVVILTFDSCSVAQSTRHLEVILAPCLAVGASGAAPGAHSVCMWLRAAALARPRAEHDAENAHAHLYNLLLERCWDTIRMYKYFSTHYVCRHMHTK